MILVVLNDNNFEYDVHSLVKAFYPNNTVKVIVDKEEENGVNAVLSEQADIRILISYESESIEIETIKDSISLGKKSVAVDSANRTQTKNRLKQLLYQVLYPIENKTLPWGTLTGIRPVKIPMTLLKDGKQDEEIKEYMKNTYFISDDKIELSLSIAKRERKILEKVNFSEGYSIYIGIPFCPTTCLYCSFTSYPISMWQSRVWDYLHALEREIRFTAEEFQHKTLNTIYIGGGTPTTLTAEQLDYLLHALESNFDLSTVEEFTVEAGRPDSITEEKLAVIKKHGVGRISINPQTMNQETLDFIGRRHSVDQFLDAYSMARKIGFDNINMDIIVGLPKETIHNVKHTMDMVEQLNPDSLTVHSLAIKRASRLHQVLKEDHSLSMINSDEIMSLTYNGAKKLDMNPYYLYRQKNITGNLENIGYAKEGKYGIYNILIMEEMQTIAALGAGSITKYVDAETGKIERNDNVKDVALYIQNMDAIIDKKREFYKQCKQIK